MAEAYKLTRENLSRIADLSERPEFRWKEDMFESMNETRFVAFDVTVDGLHHKWVSMTEKEFFEYFDFIDPTRSNKICLA